VATVSARGEVTSVGFGPANITASFQGVETVFAVNVILTDASRLAGRYRLTFTVACAMPDWARRREYDSTVAGAFDRSLVLNIELGMGRHQFEFVATETNVTIGFATQLSYGYYGPEVPVFSHTIEDRYVYTVQGTATGTLHGTGISGALAGSISARDIVAGTLAVCPGAEFSMARQ
jgi:hypothetical protein